MTECNITPGIYDSVAFSEYAAWPYWNPSTIKVMLSDSPRAMHYTIQHGRPSSDSMDLGRAEHCCVLEPFRVAQTFAIQPHYERDADNKTTEGYKSQSKATAYYKAKVREFEAANPGREVIEQDDYNRCLAMRDAIQAHASASELFDGLGQPEASIVWDDPDTGLRCKGRIDWLSLTQRRIVDLKTARNPQPWDFSKAVAKYYYHVSMGAYMDGLEALGQTINTAHFIAVGNQPWHDVIRYDIPPQVIRWGRKEWHTSLQRIRFHLRNNSWPGFAEEPLLLELPSYACPADESIQEEAA